mgnify:CR=1 FL=1|jgi:hypothetical protein|tara:strand:+ start:783 stop:1064 length:282 start_codon:yes stop_codon:yes gene_type:complete
MKITVIKGAVTTDAQIYIDGICTHEPDLSEINQNIWAVDWDTETKVGEIEFNDETQNFKTLSKSEFETTLGATITKIIKLRDARDAVIEKEEA